MSNQVDIADYRSWFNSTRYVVQDSIDRMVTDDPIFQIFGEHTDGGKEDSINVTGRSNDGFAEVKTPGQKANKTAPVEPDQMNKNFFTVAEQQIVEWEAFLHDKYQLVEDTTRELVSKINATIALSLTHQLFNYADSSTVTLPGGLAYDLQSPDSVPFVDDSHTVPGKPGSTFDNDGGNIALSNDNVTALILQGQENEVSHKGTAQTFNPDMMFVGNVQPMIEKAMQITKSTQVESTANNAISIYSGGWLKIAVLNFAPYDNVGNRDTTSKKYRWSLAQSERLKGTLKYKWASKPVAIGKFMDQENFDSSYSAAARIGFGACRWQGYYMATSTTAPTSSA